MPTYNVTSLEPFEVRRLTAMMQEALAGRLSIEGAHEVRAQESVGLLVDVVNRPPQVFVPPNTLHWWTSAAGSGTDHLRARMDCGLFFDALVERQEALQTDSGEASEPEMQSRAERGG